MLTSSFVEAYGSTIRPHLDGIPRAPVFAFLDPFGYTGIPFSVVREILQRPSAEVLVTFMYEEINRFATIEGQAVHMDQLFGTTEWRDIARLTRVSERRNFLENLYAQQLRGCTNFARSFEMRNKKNATDYFLFYATSHPLGLAKMKEAMWRVDSGGNFSFSDATDPNQIVLFGEPDHAALGEVIHAAFRGRVATVKEIERFVVERTAFTASHYKKALKSLETSTPPKVQPSDAPATRKPGTYPDGELLLRFT